MWSLRSKVALPCALALAFSWLSCSALRRFTRPERAVKPRVVGAVLPLTGKYELVGKSVLAGARLALQGSHVTLVVRDSQSEPQLAARMLEELAQQEGVIAVLGGMAEETPDLARRADELGVPLITFSKDEGVTEVGSYVFRDGPTIGAQGRAIGEYATCQLGMRSFAVLAPETDYGARLTEAFARAVSEQGGTVKRIEKYAPDQTTFRREARGLAGRAELEKRADYLAEERRIRETEEDPFRQRKALEKLRQSLPPQVDFQGLFLPDGWKTVTLIAPALAVENVVTNACEPGSLERIHRTTGRADLVTVTLLGWGGWSAPVGANGTPELLNRGGRHVHCSVYVDGFFPGSVRPATRQFVSRFRSAQGGETPTLLHALGHDAGLMFRQVIEKDAPRDSHAFRDRLAGLSGFSGATGDTRFDSDRNAVKPLFVLEVQASGIEELPLGQECRAPLARTSSPGAPHGF